MKNTWFSSDYHLGHRNIIKYDNRPFDTVEKMDQAIIKNHNEFVQPDDDFYFLGDISFNRKLTEYYLSSLNGNKFFIKGNHDSSEDTCKLYKKYGTYLGLLCETTIEGVPFTLCHYAMRVWRNSHRGTIHLYGHSHGSMPDAGNRSMDVGIMLNNYHPFSLEHILKIMEKREFKLVDHHGK